MLQWQPVLGFAFLAFLVVVTWGASQGWFSRKVPPGTSTSTSIQTVENCDEWKRRLKMCTAKNLELQAEIDRLKGVSSDAERKVTDLLETINRLTMELDALRKQNQALRNQLNDCESGYAKCRHDLANCQAELVAKRIRKQVCDFVPENSNLIR